MAVRISEQDGRTTCEARYYIASRFLSGRKFAEASRGHWGIENNLHWQLDVTFREDHLRLHKGHAPTNMSILMRTALSLLKNEPTNKSGLSTKRLTAGWNDTYLEQVLTGKAVKTR
jgi:predicted transposase YbfD/YdcC